MCTAAHLTQNHPETTVIIGHLGSPTLKDLQENGDQYWEGLKGLADHERTYTKISMLSYIDQNWDRNPLVKETVQKVIEVFGKERCFFASNFPVEIKIGWNVQRFLEAFEGLVNEFCRPADLQNLFADNARRAYLD